MPGHSVSHSPVTFDHWPQVPHPPLSPPGAAGRLSRVHQCTAGAADPSGECRSGDSHVTNGVGHVMVM